MTNSDKFSFISCALPSQCQLPLALLVALVLPLTGCVAGGPQSFASTGYVLMPADRATVNALPTPQLSAVDLSGTCRNTGPIFEDERARAKWTAPSYALPLGFWAMNYVGARAGTSAPPCTDIELATKLWQSAIGSPITGRLSERDVTEFVRIVDAHDPRYAQAGQRKMAKEKPEQRITPKQAKSGDQQHDEIDTRKFLCVSKCDNVNSLCIVSAYNARTAAARTAASELCKTKQEACMNECLSALSR